MTSRRIRTRLALGAVLGSRWRARRSRPPDRHRAQHNHGPVHGSRRRRGEGHLAPDGEERQLTPARPRTATRWSASRTAWARSTARTAMTSTSCMNHELRGTQGVRAGSWVNGAFDSHLADRLEDARGRAGRGPDRSDRPLSTTTRRIRTRTPPQRRSPPVLPLLLGLPERCRAAPQRETDRGYDGQLYFANEENGDNGRDFGVTLDGQAQQLPRLGLLSWENSLVGLNRGDTTVRPGPGGRQRHRQPAARLHRPQAPRGNAFDRAGLTNGHQFVVRPAERGGPRTTSSSGRPTARTTRPRSTSGRMRR
jgi:hypothetical protein